MPLYEDRSNATNRIEVDPEIRKDILIGRDAVVAAILELFSARSGEREGALTVAFEGWYGVDWPSVVQDLETRAAADAIDLKAQNMCLCYRSKEEIDDYRKAFVTDDPAFGRVNEDGSVEDLLEPGKIRELKAALQEAKGTPSSRSVTLIYGPGSTASGLHELYDLIFYFDMTRQPLLWQMWDGLLVSFGSESPDKDYFWKEYYYCDFYLLHRVKTGILERMDFYVEAIEPEHLKLLPRKSYDAVMTSLVRYPVKEVQIYQPGPWGAYRYRDLWEVSGLECNAWNELAGPELSMLVDIGLEQPINMPTMNLMQYAEQFVGPYLNKTCPGLFPLDVWLDDGYFPEPTPAERTSMPIHNHPGTEYVRRHFAEPLGRYETYYIAEAYEGANTWLGYKEKADLEEWERKCRQSERSMQPIEDWKSYVANWDSNVGDLYLIPAGTTHGHGGNQMVLEMDTCPSIAGTEYSFFLYDFVRPSWDDETKTMTGRPVKLHLEHGFDCEKWRRQEWVEKNLLAKPRIVKWSKGYSVDRYDTFPTMPFHIERFHFLERAENDTEGRFLHILTLTVGRKVFIRSLDHPDRESDIVWLQSVIVPACFGRYEIVNDGEGACTVVQLRWKKG